MVSTCFWAAIAEAFGFPLLIVGTVYLLKRRNADRP
jgi:hypothetical protein